MGLSRWGSVGGAESLAPGLRGEEEKGSGLRVSEAWGLGVIWGSVGLCAQRYPSLRSEFSSRAVTLDAGRTWRGSHLWIISDMALALASSLSQPESWERRVVASILQRRHLRLREAARRSRTIQLVTGEARFHPLSEGLRGLSSALTAGLGLLSTSHCPQIKQSWPRAGR